MSEDLQSIVIDNGSSTIKAGFGGDDAPRTVFPTLIGRLKQNVMMNLCSSSSSASSKSGIFIGDEAQSKRGILNISKPIENGNISNFDDLERIWNFIFYNELKINPQEHSIMLTESPLNSKMNRERMTSDMFEKFSVNSLYIANHSLLSLYASGRSTGLSIESGYDKSYAVPINDGTIQFESIMEMNIGGKHVTQYLLQLLKKKNYTELNENDLLIIDDIKEKQCFVSLPYNDRKSISIQYELPDGQLISLENERFQCTESLFNINLLGNENELINGIHEMIFQSITKSYIDIKKDLYQNMVLSGGNTMFESMRERIKWEVTSLAPATLNVCVVEPKDRKYSTWIGGSILSSLAVFQSKWITRMEYEEVGKNIVHRRYYF